MDSPAIVDLALGAERTPLGITRCWHRLAAARGWGLGFGLLLAVILAATWGRWTVQAFPLDAGREMLLPRLVLEGRAMYSEIRCCYGPLSPWIHAGLMAVFGATQDVLWWTNVLRFALTMILAWHLARRLVGPLLAGLCLAGFCFPLLHSLVVPYSSAVGWGALLSVAGLLCVARAWQSSVPREAAWLCGGLALFSLAATTRHEYTLLGGLFCMLVIADWAARHRMRLSAQHLGAMLGSAIAPFALVAGVVLAGADLHQVIRENLWMPEYLSYYGGGLHYGPGLGLSRYEAVALVTWIGLLGLGCTLVALLLGRIGRGGVLTAVVLASGLVLAAEMLDRSLPQSGSGLLAFNKNRARELIETAWVTALPLALLILAWPLARGREPGLLKSWTCLPARERLGVFCAIGYLAFLSREVATATELTRHVFTPIVLVYGLSRLARLLRFPANLRAGWGMAIASALILSAACGLDSVRFLQSRPATVLSGPTGSMYAWQRRKPYEPAWFHDTLALVGRHREDIASANVACVPQGGWVNALLDLDWPQIRDHQWEPYLSPGIAEDMTRRPPAYILAMSPLELERDFPHVAVIMRREYRPIDSNAHGMILYRHARGAHATAFTDDRRSPIAKGVQP